MNHRIVPLVEGNGEVRAAPALMRNVAQALGVYDTDFLMGWRTPRSLIVREGEIERQTIMALRQRDAHAVLVLLDADDDLGCDLGPRLLERVRRAIPSTVPAACVVAEREFETWIVGSSDRMAGKAGFPANVVLPPNWAQTRDAKGLLRQLRGGSYIASTDQERLATHIDVGVLRSRSPSFDKFVRELMRLLGALASGRPGESPGH